MKRIRLPLGDRSYTIVIGGRLLRRAGVLIKNLHIGSDAVIITNDRLARLYGSRLKRSLASSGIASRFALIPDSEKAKSIEVAQRLLLDITEYDRLRKVFVVALGGGVTGDVAGFIAAVYKRGIPYVQIPTTILAQVDSAIGGKVAIDLPAAKNLVGAFYQPRLVISDVELLSTLPERQMASGLAEIIKYGVIRDPKLFAYLERNSDKVLALERGACEYVVARSSAIKASVVARDEFDTKGLRAILNFGHTIGHALEAVSGYSARYTHGEAVAIGMAVASDISVAAGMMSSRDRDRIEKLIKKCGLPVTAKGISSRSILKTIVHDKKFINRKNRLVLPAGIGKVKIVEGVPEKLITAALRSRRFS